jgi:4-amino-4-deoxy-L-arabinose transferase-like glycosyltransferase
LKQARLNRTEVLLLAVSLLVAIAYVAGVPRNPVGFFVDEASIAYNAHTISSRGVDEYGHVFPVYFRAFGEYKSPVYIYALAAIFKFTGPSVVVARMFSAVLGLAAVLLLGLLALRTTERRLTGLVVFIAAGLTPWLFEVSRLVFEVALFPMLLVLLLLILHAASKRAEWSWPIPTSLGWLLGLMVYTYPIGRLLAPLLALGIGFFLTRRRWRAVGLTFVVFALTLVPLAVFTLRNPEALSERFKYVTYVKPGDARTQIGVRFVHNYVQTFSPRSWLLTGDPEPRHHLAGMGSLLAGATILALLGFIFILLRRRGEAWWRFVVYGLAVSPIPASLTLDHFHTLRLIALPIFLLVLTVPAIEFLLSANDTWQEVRRVALAVLVFAILLQGAVFQWRFHASMPRVDAFDSYYPELLASALNRPQRPIYLLDRTPAAYVYAFWYATLRGISMEDFHRVPHDEPAPPGAVVISHERPCVNCEIILERGQFRVYRQQ